MSEKTSEKTKIKLNTPNKLTIFRILLVPVMVIVSFIQFPGDLWGIKTQWIILDVLFIIGSLTDHWDGHLARKNNQITTFGKFLDPIADKILVISSFLLLVEQGKIPAWIPIIVILREFVVSGYRLVVVQGDGKVIAANIWGKIKTTTQMIAVIMCFLDINRFGAIFNTQLDVLPFVWNLLTTILMIVSTVATIFSGYTYLKGSKDILFKDMK